MNKLIVDIAENGPDNVINAKEWWKNPDLRKRYKFPETFEGERWIDKNDTSKNE